MPTWTPQDWEPPPPRLRDLLLEALAIAIPVAVLGFTLAMVWMH